MVNLIKIFHQKPIKIAKTIKLININLRNCLEIFLEDIFANIFNRI